MLGFLASVFGVTMHFRFPSWRECVDACEGTKRCDVDACDVVLKEGTTATTDALFCQYCGEMFACCGDHQIDPCAACGEARF